jgi:predicted O-linked N-acetylglucosamine transferase (SPINDLY family)
VAARIRAHQIDILVDLSGHTANHRLLVMAQKPAPVQISWLGYPGSTGLSTIDYRCSDPVADPADDPYRVGNEQVLRLPQTAWCYSPLSGSPELAPLPALTAGGITFGSFNNFGKTSSTTLDLWAEVLHQVPRSTLVIKNVAMGNNTTEHTYHLFDQRGISPERLQLLNHDPALKDHLLRYNQIDISLDTFPYHGTTTTCESLWMGVPVITLAGPNPASRPGPSLLQSVGLSDCIAQTPAEYIAKAVALAGDLSALAERRIGLRSRMLNSPLMDGAAFARAMEAAYRHAWHTWCSNQARSARPAEKAP